MNIEDTRIDRFERQVLAYIKKYNMFDGVKHCVCGVSGGADSVSLLTVLAKYSDYLGIELHVVHINHMIRGEAADSDQRYVERLCRERDVECDARNIDVQTMAAEKGLTVEEAGRLARYDAFDSVRMRETVCARQGEKAARKRGRPDCKRRLYLRKPRHRFRQQEICGSRARHPEP